MTSFLKKIFAAKKTWLSLAAILLIGLGRASWLWWLGPVTALFGYSLAWCAMDGKRPFWTGAWIFTAANLLHTAWFLSHPFLYIIWVWAIASFCFAVPFAILSVRIVRATSLTLLSTAGFAALFASLEWSYTQILCGYPFQLAALHLSWALAPLQIVSCFGAIGLSFLIFWANLLSFSWLCRRGALLSMIVVALIPYCIGATLLVYHRTQQASFDAITPQRTAAIIHMEEPPDVFSASLPPDVLVEREWKKIFPLLLQIRPGSVDMVILPEGTIPYTASAILFPVSELPSAWSHPSVPYISTLDVCRSAANFLKTPLLVGLEGRSYENDHAELYNSCFFVPPEPKALQRYDKQLLVPLGEYIPFASLRSYLASYGIQGSFSPGRGPVLFDKNTLRIAPFICYEEIFSEYTLSANTLQPNLLVSVSNDCWFPDSRFANEHFELARIRAVEIGKPLIRSCNKGKSGSIDALGSVITASEDKAHENACLIASVSQYTLSTLFSHIEQRTAVFFLLIFGLVAVLLPQRQ